MKIVYRWVLSVVLLFCLLVGQTKAEDIDIYNMSIDELVAKLPQADPGLKLEIVKSIYFLPRYFNEFGKSPFTSSGQISTLVKELDTNDEDLRFIILNILTEKNCRDREALYRGLVEIFMDRDKECQLRRESLEAFKKIVRKVRLSFDLWGKVELKIGSSRAVKLAKDLETNNKLVESLDHHALALIFNPDDLDAKEGLERLKKRLNKNPFLD